MTNNNTTKNLKGMLYTHMIKNVVFDIGNVLLKYNPLDFLYEMIPEEQLVNRIYEEVFRSREWLMLDRGVITRDEAINVMCNRDMGNSSIIKKVMEGWQEILKPIDGTVNILYELKKSGYKVFYLSNFHHLAHEYILKKYEFFNVFDGSVLSYKEKLLKPERDIYMKLSEAYGIKPEESVFIDDMPENIEGAEEVGLNAIQFINPDDLREKLKGFYILTIE